MKKIIYAAICSMIMMMAGSCKKDFLDKAPLDQYGENIVWTDLGLVETFVNNIYYNIPYGYYGELMMASVCDETIHTYDGGSSNVTKSLVLPSDYSVFNSSWGLQTTRMAWNWSYKNIRACNLFLEQVAKNTYSDEALRNRLTGEVYFLRAFYYHHLVFMYGGVPIIKNAYGLTDNFQQERGSFKDCIDLITADCDKAASLLAAVTIDNKNKGRATEGAALALKSRVLLYAASELYHNSSWLSGFTATQLVGYGGSGGRDAYWTAARDAAKAVMNLNRYDLYKKDPAPGDDIAENYRRIFLSKETTEDIFIRYLIPSSKKDNYNPGVYNGPNGYDSWGGNIPVSQVADAYDMQTGEKFDWNNITGGVNPYQNRDPRFYANILYDGAPFRPRSDDRKSLDPVGVIQIADRQKADGSWQGGLDGRSTPIGAKEDGTLTGYYLAKFTDRSINPKVAIQDWSWRYIRYAEVLLNYAEASAALNQEAEARNTINLIRKRAGMPPISSSGTALMESIRHERQIELMFEGQRYFDIRRWMIAPQVFSVGALGVKIAYPFGQTFPTYTISEARNRKWENKSYFLPIQIDELNRNGKLVQNPLY
ncbi:MAG TPA: RagB/SusD family nutrient uptake outer membrane protein [Chitinophagaceae bacterium]|nr:RagB/SusD family nutrient uptake outer membrane protein [Chitinophagaceae bacterium]